MATNDTTGNLDSTAFATDGGNSVLLVGVLQEDPTLEDPSSVSDAAGSYTKVGSSINIDSTHRHHVLRAARTLRGTRTLNVTFADAPTGSQPG